MLKEEKQLVKLIKEICNEEGIRFESFSDDWIIELTSKDNKKALIYSYKFPNNNAAVSKVCDDKAALSDVLQSNGINHVDHYYFERSKNPSFYEEIMLPTLANLLQKHNELVLKSNFGSGGNRVYRCANLIEIEKATFELLKSSRAMAVSPYERIKNEYRVIVLNGKVMLVYLKQRPYVIGNGKSSIEQLIENKNINKLDLMPTIDLNYIPKKDEEVTVSWKHNLGKGSLPIIVDDSNLIKQLSSIALQTSKTLNIKFASIDIIVNDENEYKILEINSGVMMEVFSSLNEENYKIAKHIYKSAIDEYFKELQV